MGKFYQSIIILRFILKKNCNILLQRSIIIVITSILNIGRNLK